MDAPTHVMDGAGRDRHGPLPRARQATIVPVRCLFAAGFLLVSIAPAWAANCTDEITAFDRRLKEEATSTVTRHETSPPRQGDDPGPAAVTNPATGAADAPDAKAANPAEPPSAEQDRFVQARALLNRAHTLAQRGDDASCLATIRLARQQLDK